MTLTVSQVEAWQPEGLQAHAAAYQATVEATDSHIRALGDHQSRVTETWHSVAADAATGRIRTEQGLASVVSGAVQQLSEASAAASGVTAAAKAHLATVVNGARAASFEVADDGQVTANAKMAALAVVGGPAADVAMLQLQSEAAAWTAQVAGGLSQCEGAANVAEGRMQVALSALHDAQAALGAAPRIAGLVDLLTGKTTPASVQPGSLQDILARAHAPVQGPHAAESAQTTAAAATLLPGTPIPEAPGQAAIVDANGTTRVVPGTGVRPGFMDTTMSSQLARTYGQSIKIDPDTTPGAKGTYSGNILKPDPTMSLSGGASKAAPSVSVPAFTTDENGIRKPGSLSVDMTRGAQIRIVGAEPYQMSTVDYGGNRELAVSYRYQYQVQNVYTAQGNAFQYSEPWKDASIDDVNKLAKLGVEVPRIR